MALDAGLALQKTLYATLSGDTALTGLIGLRLYDNVPGDTAFPYVTMGEGRMMDWSSDTHDGAEHRLVFHIYTRTGGRSLIKTITGALKARLHNAPLVLTDHRLVNMRFVEADIVRLADGVTWHGLVRFRAVTEAI